MKAISWLLLFCGLLCSSAAIAGGRGGHNTTFDCNVWGGSCACWMSAASGKCGNATAHFSNAPCTGGDDSAALADWISYGHGLGATRAVINIPDGCVEGVFGGNGNSSFSADLSVHCAGFGTNPDTTIQNAVIWGYGTTFASFQFGGQGIFGNQYPTTIETNCIANGGPSNTSPLIQAPNPGDTTVTVITPSDLTCSPSCGGTNKNISPGDWIVLSALGTQGCGSAPINPAIWEWKLITAVNYSTGLVALNEPVKNSGYKTTYPFLGLVLTSLVWSGGIVTATTASPHGLSNGSPVTIIRATPSQYNGFFQATVTGSNTFTYPLASNPGAETIPGTLTCNGPYDGGAAAISLAQKSYNTISQYYGMTVNDAGEALITGRNISLIDVNLSANGGIAPSSGETLSFIFGQFNNIENDKLIDNLNYFGTNLYGINTVQSSSIHNLNIANSKSRFWQGTPFNATISNSKFDALTVGPLCCGMGNAVTLDNVVVTVPFPNQHFSFISSYSFSGGTLTISKTDPEWTNGKGPGLWVPGNEYYMGDNDGSNTCASPNTFHVTGLDDAGANVAISTDIVSIPTGNICLTVRPPSTFGAYRLKTLIQKFTGPYFLNFPETLQP